MITFAIMREALSAVWGNKLRSGLTVLGMVMGITSVIAIVSTVEGMQSNMEDVFSNMGQNTFMVTRFGIVTSWSEYEKKRRRKIITRDFIEPIKDGCDACEDVGAEGYANSNIKYGSKTMPRVSIEGQTSNHLAMRDVDVFRGRYFSEEEERGSKNVVFVGQDVVEDLFEGEDPLGKTIRIRRLRYTVIGIADKIGSLFGQSQDEFIYMPLSTLRKNFGEQGRRVNLVVKAVSRDRLEEAMDQTRVVLRSKRHVPYDEEDDFDLLTPDAILSFINTFTRAFRVILVALPFLSIVIGGIVVMNIMMVSVTERTREIGVRKSLGARQSHIRSQFLYETLTLSAVGGLFGILFGMTLAGAILSWMDIHTPTTMLAVYLGVGISTTVGLFFGIYPAVKAARLDPIKALSFE
ncbi:MAG: ABC transporter permease [candidate division Zixibacteria bacterium]|nr:ABC transporter permease [candidate division Zixibacteria bacterium]